MTRFRTLLARAVELREGEGPALAWSTAYFFLLFASYYVIRPLRDEMGVRGSESALSWLFVGTLAGTAALNPLFGTLVSRLTRKVFVPVVYRVLVATLVLFWALLSFAPQAQKPAWRSSNLVRSISRFRRIACQRATVLSSTPQTRRRRSLMRNLQRGRKSSAGQRERRL